MLKSRGLIISVLEVENSYQPDSGDVVKAKVEQIFGVDIADPEVHHLLKEVAREENIDRVCALHLVEGVVIGGIAHRFP